MNTQVSRRDLLKLGGVATVSAMGASMLSGCTPAEVKEETANQNEVSAAEKITLEELNESVAEEAAITEFVEELTYDIIVIGAGTTGIPTALAAYEEGADVAVLQKEAAPVAQGMLAARVVKEKSTPVGIAQYIHEMHSLYDHRPDLSLLRVYAENSQEAVEWYQSHLKAVDFEEYKESDSKDHVYDDGNCYIEGMLFPDSMQAPTTALAEQIEKEGVDFYYETPAVQLIVENGAVVGVAGKTKDGEYKKFLASKGVVIATGDYQNNTAMVERYVVDAQPFNRKQLNKTGDGHLIGLMAGAVMEPGCHCKMIHGGRGCFREEPFLAVNLNGERFMYEDVAYGDRNTILRDQPENRMITLFDNNYTEQVFSWGSDPTVPTVANGKPEQIEKFVEDEVLLKADTIEELAEKMGVPSKALVETVDRYNELCAAGEDLDFGKASKYMQPVDTPPFYAMPREYAIASIPAGLVVNANGQCKNEEGELIEGLFAAGNCSGPFYSDVDYSLSTMGLSIGRCITAGYMTGRYVANQ